MELAILYMKGSDFHILRQQTKVNSLLSVFTTIKLDLEKSVYFLTPDNLYHYLTRLLRRSVTHKYQLFSRNVCTYIHYCRT